MQICTMDYNDISKDGNIVKLRCPGAGTFDVLSGIGRYINKPDCSDIEKAAIPPGTYWIVDRPKGTFANQVRSEVIDIANLYRSRHTEWFGLYSSQTMSDHLYVNGVRRGSFRLHPLNSDGPENPGDVLRFIEMQIFRFSGMRYCEQKKVGVPGGRGLMAYGFVEVKGIPNFSKCDVR